MCVECNKLGIIRLAPLLPPCLMSANIQREGEEKESAANINQMMAAQAHTKIITHFATLISRSYC